MESFWPTAGGIVVTALSGVIVALVADLLRTIGDRRARSLLDASRRQQQRETALVRLLASIAEVSASLQNPSRLRPPGADAELLLARFLFAQSVPVQDSAVVKWVSKVCGALPDSKTQWSNPDYFDPSIATPLLEWSLGKRTAQWFAEPNEASFFVANRHEYMDGEGRPLH
jgi:hypothetical protein